MNVSQRMEVEKIVSNFTEKDNEAVYEEVERLDKQMRIGYMEKMLREHLPHCEAEIFALAADSSEFQEIASKAIWDCLTEIVKRERAVEIYRNKHRYDEVA
ncbi:hypothetical protein [Serratia marcescens]|uniref:hypothetical protein n=1 Tax=Serratia marcescens TaxID=615 RepID=UPI0036F5295E